MMNSKFCCSALTGVCVCAVCMLYDREGGFESRGDGFNNCTVVWEKLNKSIPSYPKLMWKHEMVANKNTKVQMSVVYLCATLISLKTKTSDQKKKKKMPGIKMLPVQY